MHILFRVINTNEFTSDPVGLLTISPKALRDLKLAVGVAAAGLVEIDRRLRQLGGLQDGALIVTIASPLRIVLLDPLLGDDIEADDLFDGDDAIAVVPEAPPGKYRRGSLAWISIDRDGMFAWRDPDLPEIETTPITLAEIERVLDQQE